MRTSSEEIRIMTVVLLVPVVHGNSQMYTANRKLPENYRIQLQVISGGARNLLLAWGWWESRCRECHWQRVWTPAVV